MRSALTYLDRALTDCALWLRLEPNMPSSSSSAAGAGAGAGASKPKPNAAAAAMLKRVRANFELLKPALQHPQLYIHSVPTPASSDLRLIAVHLPHVR